MQFGARRVVAQNIEADIAGADQVAAGDRRVDVVDGAFQRGTASGRAKARQPADALIVEDLDLLAARAGAQQARALPFIEPAADGLAAHAEIGGDMLLGDLARKAHAIALGDADIRRQLDQPVGKQQVGEAAGLVVLLLERGEQALRADADQPRAEHGIGLDQRADQRQRQRHDGGRREREGRGRPPGGLGRQALLQQLELAEHLAMHDALESERALAGLRLELDLHQRIDMQPLAAGPRAEQEIDGVGRIARLEHPFAGGERAQLQARAADQLMRGIAGPAHQRRPGNLVWERLVHPGRNLGRQDGSVVDFPRAHHGRKDERAAHG